MRMIMACLGRDWEVSPGLEKPMSPRVASGGRGMMKGRRKEKGYYDQSGWQMKKEVGRENNGEGCQWTTRTAAASLGACRPRGVPRRIMMMRNMFRRTRAVG